MISCVVNKNVALTVMDYITEDVYNDKIMPYFDYPLNLVLNKKSLNVVNRKKGIIKCSTNMEKAIDIRDNSILINGLEVYMNVKEHIEYYGYDTHELKDVEYFMAINIENKFIELFNGYSENISYLKINFDFNHDISNLNIMYENLRELDLSENKSFNQSLDNFHLLEKLECLKLGYGFNRPINNLPKSLVTLTISGIFNQPINDLPEELKYLEIDAEFNQPINNIPSGIKHLKILGKYNQPIDFILQCQSLKYLELGSRLNYPIIDFLPDSLICLILRCSLNDPILHFPNKLRKLVLREKINGSLDNLPKTLEILVLKKYNKQITNFPNNITYLDLGRFYNHRLENLPKKLNYFIVSTRFNQHIDDLPDTVTHVFLGYDYNMPIEKLPSKLKLLSFSRLGRFCQELEIINFNYTLTHLRLQDNYNKKIEHFPINLEYLEVGDRYNHSLDNLPNTMKYIKLGNDYNKNLDNLPDSIIGISISGACVDFNQPIKKLPSGLKYFRIESFYRPKYNKKIYYLPDSLEYLHIKWKLNIETESFPKSLKVLILKECNKKLNNLPKHLEELHISDVQLIIENNGIIDLPKSLKCLIIDGYDIIDNKDFIKNNKEITNLECVYLGGNNYGRKYDFCSMVYHDKLCPYIISENFMPKINKVKI